MQSKVETKIYKCPQKLLNKMHYIFLSCKLLLLYYNCYFFHRDYLYFILFYLLLLLLFVLGELPPPENMPLPPTPVVDSVLFFVRVSIAEGEGRERFSRTPLLSLLLCSIMSCLREQSKNVQWRAIIVEKVWSSLIFLSSTNQ